MESPKSSISTSGNTSGSTSGKTTSTSVLHHPQPVRQANGNNKRMTAKEERELQEVLALADGIVRPPNTGARQMRPKPSDPRLRNRELSRQFGY
jgi:hypothetical protein